jgi:hypothetical protein
MCPGPIIVNIGESNINPVAALHGALTRAGAFGRLYERLRPLFQLPEIRLGTGDG